MRCSSAFFSSASLLSTSWMISCSSSVRKLRSIMVAAPASSLDAHVLVPEAPPGLRPSVEGNVKANGLLSFWAGGQMWEVLVSCLIQLLLDNLS